MRFLFVADIELNRTAAIKISHDKCKYKLFLDQSMWRVQYFKGPETIEQTILVNFDSILKFTRTKSIFEI